MAVAKHTLGDKQAEPQMNSRAEIVTSICALAVGFTESSWALVRVRECAGVCKSG